MKKLDLGQTVTILANVGIIAGIVFLGIELQQNNALLGAEARATRAQVRMDGTDLAISSPELMGAFAREQSGEPLSELDQMYLNMAANGVFVRWEYVYGEFREGLIEEDSVPVENWRYVFNADPTMVRQWEEIGRFSFHPDFVQWMDENVVNW